MRIKNKKAFGEYDWAIHGRKLYHFWSEWFAICSWPGPCRIFQQESVIARHCVPEIASIYMGNISVFFIILPGVLCWSGPVVRPVFSAGGISGLSINGAVGAATWLVGNTQGGLDDDFLSWEVLTIIWLGQ